MDQMTDILVQKPTFLKLFITYISVSNKRIEIWGQTESTLGSIVRTKLDSFHCHLSDIFAVNSQLLRPIPVPEVGKYYLTHMKNDLNFYRCVVTHVSTDSGLSMVHFIDIGCEDWVPFNHLVDFDQLFDIKPLAQKFYLADIMPKERDWDLEEVKRMTKPFLLNTYASEVIAITRNTQCIRVYDEFFGQPLIATLVRDCGGVLCYNLFGGEVVKAVDLVFDNRFGVKEMNGNTSQLSFGSIDKSFDSQTESPMRVEAENNLKLTSTDENQKPVVLTTTIEKTFNNFEKIVPKFIPQKYEPNDSSNHLSSEEVVKTKEEKDKTEDISMNLKFAFNDITNCQTIDTKVCQSMTESLNDFEVNSSDESQGKAVFEADEQKPISESSVISNQIKVELNSSDVLDKTGNQFTVSPIGDTLVKFESIVNDMNETEPQMDSNKTKEFNEFESKDVIKCESIEANVGSIDPLDTFGLLGTKSGVFMTNYRSENSFDCHLVSNFDVISDLSEKMSEYYDKIRSTVVLALDIQTLKVNEAIASRFSGDSLWYRASVKAIHTDTLEVVYNDYGNEDTVKVIDCKALTDGFRVLEPQVIHCQFIEKIPEKTLNQYMDDLNEIVLDFLEITAKNAFKVKVLEVKK